MSKLWDGLGSRTCVLLYGGGGSGKDFRQRVAPMVTSRSSNRGREHYHIDMYRQMMEKADAVRSTTNRKAPGSDDVPA